MGRWMVLLAASLILAVACDSDGGSGEVTCDPACDLDACQACVDGACVDACAEGETCDGAGMCVDPACEACDAAACEVCEDGACVSACVEGEVCDDGACIIDTQCDPACDTNACQECQGGMCVVTCDADACETCDGAGNCTSACAEGETCDGAGTCVLDTVTCEPACDADACETCDTTTDPANPVCASTCVEGEVCDGAGSCIDESLICDPACGDDETCVNGTCLTSTNHTGLSQLAGPFATGPEVTAACLGCHEDEATDFMQTAHWTWMGPTPGWDGREGETTYGKVNLINNFCVAVTSNWGRCTQCHAGYGWADDTFDFEDSGNVDCLVCHDGSGQYAKDPKKAGAPAETVDLVLAAKSVGAPTRKNCGACHFKAGGGDNVKKGDMGSWAVSPEPEADVHMGNGMQCTACHAAADHKLAGSGLHLPVEEATLSCMDCHQGPVVHEDNAIAEQHRAHVACVTCHIPTFSRQQATKLDWKWSEAGDAEREPVTDEYGKPDYDKMKGEFVWGMDVEPTLAWWNGTFTRMAVSDTVTGDGPYDMGSPMGSIDDATAKIYPFKVMTGNQPFDDDNMYFLVPHLFGMQAGENPYWAVWDWDLALAEGAAAANQDFSGNWSFAETYLYMALEHEVAPASAARGCGDCHGTLDFTELGYDSDPSAGDYSGPTHATD